MTEVGVWEVWDFRRFLKVELIEFVDGSDWAQGLEAVRGRKDSRKTTSSGARATMWTPGPLTKVRT